MTSHETTVDGIPMRWEEAGEGRPVVLVHGIPTSPALWRHVVPRLAGVRALAWEMVGYGESIPAGRGRDISVGRQADHLVAWLRELGVEDPIVVGHDLGGGVAQIAAARNPGLFSGIVLINAIGYDSWPVPPVKVLAALGSLVQRLPAGAVARLVQGIIVAGHDDAARRAESAEIHAAPYRHGDPAAFVRQVRSLNVHDTPRRPRRPSAPRPPGPRRLGRRRPVPDGRVRGALRHRPGHRSATHRGRQALHARGPPRGDRRRGQRAGGLGLSQAPGPPGCSRNAAAKRAPTSIRGAPSRRGVITSPVAWSACSV